MILQKQRQAIVDVELKVQEKKGEAIVVFLKELGQEPIDSTKLAELRQTNTTLETNFKAEIEKATAQIRASEASSYNAQKNIDAANAKAAAATQAAELTSAKTQVIFYENEVKELRKQLSEEREARVKEAQARGNSQVTVNTTGK